MCCRQYAYANFWPHHGVTETLRHTEKTGISLRAALVGSVAAVAVAPKARRENTRTEIQEGQGTVSFLYFPFLCSRELAAKRPTKATAARAPVVRISSCLRALRVFVVLRFEDPIVRDKQHRSSRKPSCAAE